MRDLGGMAGINDPPSYRRSVAACEVTVLPTLGQPWHLFCIQPSPGAALTIATAFGGPLIEVSLINAPPAWLLATARAPPELSGMVSEPASSAQTTCGPSMSAPPLVDAGSAQSEGTSSTAAAGPMAIPRCAVPETALSRGNSDGGSPGDCSEIGGGAARPLAPSAYGGGRSSRGLYRYTHPDVAGVPSWVPWVYACGGPAVGNLGRRVWADLQRSRAAQQGCYL
jgi:hypothetical protein